MTQTEEKNKKENCFFCPLEYTMVYEGQAGTNFHLCDFHAIEMMKEDTGYELPVKQKYD